MSCEIPYSFYGANDDAFYCKDSECILSGPADTGKTLTLLTKLHLLAFKYPGASLVIARKQLTDTYSTVLVTFRKKVLGDDSHVEVYGGEKAQWFDYPNGSRIWVAGMDKAGKVLSAEHDVIYVNQAEQLSLMDWETLTTRTTGRAGHVPYPQTIGDCNPAGPTHWIKSRSKDGGPLALFESTHRDNPELFDPATGEMTERGEKRLKPLKNLTGARLMRLYHGLWAAPEGAIYDVFDEEKHVVKSFEPATLWPRWVGIDPFGAQVAALWFALDVQSGIVNAYREYCEPFGLTTAGHAANLLRMSKRETIFAWVCGGPSERAWRLEWEAAGVPVVEPPVGDVWVGIDRLYRMLKDFRMVVHDCCHGFLSEIGDYRRKLDKAGQPTEAIENKEQYHLLDCARYAIVWATEPEGGTQVVYAPVRIGARF